MAKLTSDPLDILLLSDEWGTRTVLEACVPLPREQFHRPFEIGLGSLHNVLTHIVGVMRRWADRIDGREPLRPSLAPIPARPDIPHEGRDRTPAELLELLTEAGADLRAVAAKWRAKPDGLASLVHLEWPQPDGSVKRHTFTRGCCLVHVCTHGMYHRAQCMNMLRHLKVPGLSDRLPEVDPIDWQAEVESPGVEV
ncbi:MAG: DinB family protein [Phycisphaerales bacterium]|nr:DinB family protein [Phycisphaerales bacterium]